MTIRGPLYTPRQTKRPIPLQDFQSLQLQTLTASAQPITGIDWNNPQKSIKPPPAFLFQNLLETTLAPVISAAPIFPPIWETPKKKAQQQVLDSAYSILYLTIGNPLVPQELSPYRAKKSTQQSDAAQNILLGMPVISQAPFSQQDWSVAASKKNRNMEVIQNFQTFIASQPTPALRFEWELPTKRGKTLQPDVLQNLQPSLYAVFPQIRQEISDPVKRAKTQQPPHVWQGLASFYAQQPTPKITQEHQNPVKRGKSQQPYEFQALTLTTLFVADTTPDAFSFVDQTDVDLNTAVISAPIAVSGINSPATITITGGEYSINGGAFTSSSGLVSNGDLVRAQVTSSGTALTAVNAVVTIGGVSDTFTATTGIGEDTRVYVPYLIGSTAEHATQQLASVHLSVVISGTSGTVTAQSVEFMTLVERNTSVTITLGGAINNPKKGKRLPNYAAPDRLQ